MNDRGKVTPNELCLEDLTVGDTFRSPEMQMDAAQIKEFAAQYDPQPFHLDEEAAQNSFFHGLAASGWHTAAITMRLLVASVPIKGGIVGGGSNVSWLRPVRPGETLNVISKINAISLSQSKPDRGIVELESHTLNQDGELCQRTVAQLIVFRRSRTQSY